MLFTGTKRVLAARARILLTSVAAIFLLLSVRCASAGGQTSRANVPLIFCTDLFHPPDDPDDTFDLATVFLTQEFDIRAVILDQGDKQMNRTGKIPVEQMMAITGRKVTSVYGLPHKLKSPSDKALDQPSQFQSGVETILNVLRSADHKVTIITVGSLRDVCAAFNRQPQLIAQKTERLYVVAGHSDGGEEYNVQLDPHAYIGIMRSGLPIYWLPCFGREPYVCRWEFKHGDLFDAWSLPLQNFFLYALTKADPANRDPVLALYDPISESLKETVWRLRRAMWSTAAIVDAARRTIASDNGRWHVLPAAKTSRPNPVFRFVPAKVTVSDTGVTRSEDIDLRSLAPNMHVFRFEGAFSDYNTAMGQALEGLLKHLGR